MMQFFSLLKNPAFSCAWFAGNVIWVFCAAQILSKQQIVPLLLVWLGTMVAWAIASSAPASPAKQPKAATPAAAPSTKAPDFRTDLRAYVDGDLTLEEICERWHRGIPPKPASHEASAPPSEFPDPPWLPCAPSSGTSPRGFKVGDLVRLKSRIGGYRIVSIAGNWLKVKLDGSWAAFVISEGIAEPWSKFLDPFCGSGGAIFSGAVQQGQQPRGIDLAPPLDQQDITMNHSSK